MRKAIGIVLLVAIIAVFFGGCQAGTINSDKSKQLSQNASTILDLKPEFIDANEAFASMKSRPVGTDPWQIYYASSNYVYVTYNFGVEFIFRYNVKSNIIDKALDVRCLHKDISGPSSTNCQFSSDGLRALFTIGATGANRSDVSKDLYEANFEKETILLSAKSGEDFNQSSDEEFYKAEGYGVSADKYRAKLNENPLLPKLYDWSTVAQVDDDTFCVIMPNDPENSSPGAGYYYYKFVVINVTQNKIIQEHRIDSTE